MSLHGVPRHSFPSYPSPTLEPNSPSRTLRMSTHGSQSRGMPRSPNQEAHVSFAGAGLSYNSGWPQPGGHATAYQTLMPQYQGMPQVGMGESLNSLINTRRSYDSRHPMVGMSQPEGGRVGRRPASAPGRRPGDAEPTMHNVYYPGDTEYAGQTKRPPRRKGPLVYYVLENDDGSKDTFAHPNAFQLIANKPLKLVVLRDIRESFPLPGTWHFRFKHADTSKSEREVPLRVFEIKPTARKASAMEKTYFWIDVTDDDAFVPSFNGKIMFTAVRIATAHLPSGGRFTGTFGPETGLSATSVGGGAGASSAGFTAGAYGGGSYEQDAFPTEWPLQQLESPLESLGLRGYAQASDVYRKSQDLTRRIREATGQLSSSNTGPAPATEQYGKEFVSIDVTQQVKSELAILEDKRAEARKSAAKGVPDCGHLLTEHEKRKVRRIFAKYDQGARGEVDKGTFAQVLAEMLEEQPTMGKIEKALREMGGGEIVGLEALLEWWAAQKYTTDVPTKGGKRVRFTDKMTDQERWRADDTFRQYDRSGRGRIDIKDLAKLLTDMNHGTMPESSLLRRAMKEMDVNGNGVIDKEEFIEWWARQLYTKAGDPDSKAASFTEVEKFQILQKFNRFDLNRTGKVDGMYLEQDVVQDDIPPNVLEDALREIDVAGRGHITFEPFLDWYGTFLAKGGCRGARHVSTYDPDSRMAPRLSEEERARIREAFADFDERGDGAVPIGLFDRLMVRLGQRKPSPAQVQKAIREMARRHNNDFTLDEFMEWWACQRLDPPPGAGAGPSVERQYTLFSELPQREQSRVTQIFDRFDMTSRNMVSVHHLERILFELERRHKPTRETLRQCQEELDPRHNGKIDLKALGDWWARRQLGMQPGYESRTDYRVESYKDMLPPEEARHVEQVFERYTVPGEGVDARDVMQMVVDIGMPPMGNDEFAKALEQMVSSSRSARPNCVTLDAFKEWVAQTKYGGALHPHERSDLPPGERTAKENVPSQAHRLSAFDRKRVRDIFLKFDKTRERCCDISDLHRVIAMVMGTTPTSSMLKEAKRECDPRGTGRVELDEFLEYYAKRKLSMLVK